MITDVQYFIDTDGFVKIYFFFTGEQEAVEQFLLNVLFIVVMDCLFFFYIRFSQLYYFM